MHRYTHRTMHRSKHKSMLTFSEREYLPAEVYCLYCYPLSELLPLPDPPAPGCCPYLNFSCCPPPQPLPLPTPPRQLPPPGSPCIWL